VPVAVFDPAAGRWRGVAAVGPVACERLTLSTFNVWFDPYHAEDRYGAIADLLATTAPDVMVFQEVTATAAQIMLAQKWIRDSYVCAAVVGARTGDYGMLMLSRVPIQRATYVPLPTRAHRGVLTADLGVAGVPLRVGSVHLDSGKAASRLRDRQLRHVFRTVSSAQDVVLLGDFNMRDDENPRIRPPFVDVWPALRPDEPGFTEDTSVNLMRLDSTGKQRHVRFDRVILAGNGWRAASIDLLGTAPICPALPRVFPSDHFGLYCELVRPDAARMK
jgi:tyrosyl-DNA phosphodiesterase 2